MIIKPWECQRDDTWLLPFQHLLEIRTCRTKWEYFFDKTYEWVAWRWVNPKIDKESLAILKQIVNISKEDMENYHWAMFTHAMDIFFKHASLKKLIQEHFFTSLLNNLSTKDLVSLENLLSINS
jgi:hypothetical protein